MYPTFLDTMKDTSHRYDELGIQCWHGTPSKMEQIHSHMEIEFNLVEKGSISYLFGSEERTFRQGELTVFSALEAHQMTHSSPGTVISWLTIPASSFSSWKLSENLTDRILSGEIITNTDPLESERDPGRFQRWRQDLEHDDPRYLGAMLQEVQARLARLALSQSTQQIDRSTKTATPWSNPISGMTAYMLKHLTEDTLNMERIASSVGLNPSYASTLYNRKMGQTPIQFLTDHRLQYTKFLLATTDRTVLDIAHESGFGSSSRFYATFKKAFGKSPAQLR